MCDAPEIDSIQAYPMMFGRRVVGARQLWAPAVAATAVMPDTGGHRLICQMPTSETPRISCVTRRYTYSFVKLDY